MLTQEEYMDVLKLQHQGFTITEIAEELGYHPATISKLDQRRRSAAAAGDRSVRDADRRVLVRADRQCCWRRTRDCWPRACSRSSRPRVRGQLPERSRVTCVLSWSARSPRGEASVPIETAPGEECQFDWSDCSDFGGAVRAGRAGLLRGDLVLVPLAPVVVRHLGRPPAHLGGPGPFYEAAGGCPFSRTDRMGPSGSRGRRFVLAPAVMDFARLHGTIGGMPAGDAKRKGKSSAPSGT